MHKACNKCGFEKPLSDFYKQERCLDGVRSSCKVCVNKRRAKHYQENKELYKTRNSAWRVNNNRSNYYASYRESNKEKIKEYTKANKHLYAKNRAIRRARVIQRTPIWLNAAELFEIDCVYRYCSSLRAVGLNYEVDHILPLAGKSASGLHVPMNLQVIPTSENRKKANK